MQRLLLFFIIFSAGAVAGAAGTSGVVIPSAPIERGDFSSLQRGAATFINYCSGCHSAEYIRYGRIAEDLGIDPAVLREKLIFNEVSLSSGIESSMDTEEATEWFHQAAPPDLSLSAKLRGVDWLYSYLRGFYRQEDRPSGWNNQIFPNVAMPHVLADLQGEFAVNAEGEKTLIRPGRLSSTEYDLMIIDLVNFMDYIAEPARAERYRAGYLILSLLLLLLLCTFFLYREYWRDIN
ncbi:MAG: cytochrome c1 [Proteobacteria bacterium]|nr:cytochrome c1 [Pseudomonadota bacterium]